MQQSDADIVLLTCGDCITIAEVGCGGSEWLVGWEGDRSDSQDERRDRIGRMGEEWVLGLDETDVSISMEEIESC
jgi:hypothetical protein